MKHVCRPDTQPSRRRLCLACVVWVRGSWVVRGEFLQASRRGNHRASWCRLGEWVECACCCESERASASYNPPCAGTKAVPSRGHLSAIECLPISGRECRVGVGLLLRSLGFGVESGEALESSAIRSCPSCCCCCCISQLKQKHTPLHNQPQPTRITHYRRWRLVDTTRSAFVTALALA